MGIKFDKINPDIFSMSYPVQIINLREAGCVYFVEHNPG
jgi:hypothetical protein